MGNRGRESRGRRARRRGSARLHCDICGVGTGHLSITAGVEHALRDTRRIDEESIDGAVALQVHRQAGTEDDGAGAAA